MDRRKVVRLRDPYAAAAERVDLPSVSQEEQNRPYKALSVIGEIKEKGFATSVIRVPEVTLLPFPVARHRSEGPHWTPLQTKQDEAEDMEEEDDDQEMNVAAAAAMAQPLVRKKKPGLQLQNFKELLSQQTPTKSKPVSSGNSRTAQSEISRELSSVPPPEDGNTESLTESTSASSKGHVLPPFQSSDLREKGPATSRPPMMNSRKDIRTGEQDAIDVENRQRIASMTPVEIAEAQQELLGKLSPEVLAMFKKRSAIKEPKTPVETVEPMEVDEDHAHERASQREPDASSSWTDRVEAVKLIRFDFDGNVLCEGDSGQPMDFQSVAERDFLRSEGDPAAYGYTIKEATELLRSTISGQRAFASQLISSILQNAADGLCSNRQSTKVDWQAIWAYALGPHPQLALSLRMAMDDAHATSLTASAKAMQALLSCSQNDYYFDLCEDLWPGEPLVYTAPVFRKQVNQDEGFVGGGYWKYNVKPEEMLSRFYNESEDSTIGDDAAVAERDVAAGLLSMGILPRIRYILEVEKVISAEESLLSLLVAFGRHSPTSAEAVMKCPRLLETIVQRFLLDDGSTATTRGKAIQLLKVLSQASNSNCVCFASSGTLQVALSDLFTWSMHFARSGPEIFKGSYSSTVIEALRLWRVCIYHELGFSLFTDVYPALCLWLSPPSSTQTLSNEVNEEALLLAQESYGAVEMLARKLPILREENQCNGSQQTWSWSIAVPLVQTSLEWLQPLAINAILKELETPRKPSSCKGSFTGALAAVLHFLSTVCEKICSEERMMGNAVWLPEFLPQVGLSLVKSRLLSFSGDTSIRDGLGRENEVSVYLASCLQGAIRLAIIVDKLLNWARSSRTGTGTEMSTEESTLQQGLVKSSQRELQALLFLVRSELASNSDILRAAEYKDRGGPAPGVGFGWGALAGGFWSPQVLVARAYANIILDLETILSGEDENRRLVDTLHSCLTVAAISIDRHIVKRVLSDVMFSRARWLLILGKAVQTFNEWKAKKSSGSTFVPLDAEGMRLSLIQHYSQVWLSRKSKKKKGGDKEPETLATIDEEVDTVAEAGERELVVELPGIRLPLPWHWFLSPLHSTSEDIAELKNVIQAGLLLLLCLEGSQSTGVQMARKIHALSTAFVAGDVFLEKDVNDILGVLQDIYGAELDSMERGGKPSSLDFNTHVNSSYSLFAENLAVDFACASYGDITFGRQTAFYLQRQVPFPLRQTVWRVLAEARALELLPAIEDCPGSSNAYLCPPESDSEALELYVSTWISGGLERAFSRDALPFRLALHHVAEFLFKNESEELVRKKFARSIIRTSKRNRQAEQMFRRLVEYFPAMVDRNLELLVEACEQDISLRKLI